jgi:glycerol-3-phosphate responsive antiterminator
LVEKNQQRKIMLETQILSIKKNMDELKESEIKIFLKMDEKIGEQFKAEIAEVMKTASKYQKIKV